MLRLLLLSIITLFVGLGAGLGAGYAGLNPQVNQLSMRLESLEGFEQQDGEANAEVDSLVIRNSELELELDSIRKQLNDAELLKEQLERFMAPDVRVLGEPSSEEIVENGREGYTLNVNLMNFGLEDARDVEVTITWVQVTACGCDSEPGHVEVIRLESLSSRSPKDLKMVFFFTLSRDLISVHADVDWAR